MRIRIRLFARYRELLGRDLLELEVPDGTTAGEAFDQLADLHTDLKPLRASTLMAIESEFVKPNVRLRAGEELKLMPPVSGGSC